MFNIYDSNVKVTKLRSVTDKMTVGIAYSTHKDRNNNYVKTFIECKIVGKALTKFNELCIMDKQKINIIEGSIRNEQFNYKGAERSKLVLTIYDMQEYKEN